MTTGRINQVTTVERRRWTVARGKRRRATTAFNTVWAQKHTETLETPLATWSTREGKPFVDKVYFDSRTVVEVQHESPENFQRFAQPPEPLGREGRAPSQNVPETLGATLSTDWNARKHPHPKNGSVGAQATGQTALRRKQARTLGKVHSKGNWRCHINGTQHYGTDNRIYRPSYQPRSESPLEPRNGAQDGQPCARRSQLTRKDVPTPVTD